MPDIKDTVRKRLGITSAYRIRILHILHSLRRAGAEMLAYELAVSNQDALETGVIVLDEMGPLAEEFDAINVPVWFTSRCDGYDRSQVRQIAGILAEFQPDVIQAHQYTPLFYTVLARRKQKTGHILFTEHGRHYPDVVSWKRRLANRLYFARRAEKVTAVCDFTRRALIEKEGVPNKKIEVIYNGVEMQRFDQIEQAEARQQWALPDQTPVVVQVGNLRSVKDHPTALRAFAQTHRKVPESLLLLAGDGPDRRKLEALADELGIAKSVRFLGNVKEIPSLLTAADVMLMTSVSEAHSVSLLEAMASRLPIVATAVGGIPETVVDGQTGLLAARGDAGALAANLVRLLRDPAQRQGMGDAGFERCRRMFQREDMHRRYLEIYRDLAGDGS
ncbi:MAG: glycosyltransferase [Planctomycetota bacterium]